MQKIHQENEHKIPLPQGRSFLVLVQDVIFSCRRTFRKCQHLLGVQRFFSLFYRLVISNSSSLYWNLTLRASIVPWRGGVQLKLERERAKWCTTTLLQKTKNTEETLFGVVEDADYERERERWKWFLTDKFKVKDLIDLICLHHKGALGMSNLAGVIFGKELISDYRWWVRYSTRNIAFCVVLAIHWQAMAKIIENVRWKIPLNCAPGYLAETAKFFQKEQHIRYLGGVVHELFFLIALPRNC